MDLAINIKRDSSNGEVEKITQVAPNLKMAAKNDDDSGDDRSRTLENADVDDVYMVPLGPAFDGSTDKSHSSLLHIPVPDDQQASNYLMENKNTNRKTGADMKILHSYLKSLNEKRPPECLPPIELDKYLSSFFMVVRKFDGAEYEPCSLRAMLASIERYLKLKCYPTSLTRDLHFAKTRAALKLKQQMLKQMGKGVKSQICSTSHVMEQRLSQLCKSQEFGPYSPVSILFSLCFVFVMNLKMRKATEHKKLLWGDIMLGVEEESGREYLAFSPQMMHRTPSSSIRQTQEVIWSKPDIPDQDPVALYRLYMEKRPIAANHRYSPFYLGVNVSHPAPAQSWYRPCALGMNKLNEMVRQIRDLTGMAAQASSETSPSQADGGDSNCESLNADSEETETDNYVQHDNIKSEPEACHGVSRPESELDSSDSLSYQSLTFNEDQPEDNGDTPDGFHGSTTEFTPEDIVHNLASESQYPEQSAYIDLSTAKQQLSGILQQMDILDLVAFDHWLKRMKIGRDTNSGKIVCREVVPGILGTSPVVVRKRSRDCDTNSSTSPEKTLVENANITLNICLTPQAIVGGGPVTVTAQATSFTSTENIEEVLVRNNNQEKTPPTKPSSTAGIAKSPYPLHIFDNSAAKHPRLSSGMLRRDANSHSSGSANSQKSNSTNYLKQFNSGQSTAASSNSSRTMSSYLSLISKTTRPELSIVKTVLQQTLRPKTESSKSSSLYQQSTPTDLTNGHSSIQEHGSGPVFPKPEPV